MDPREVAQILQSALNGDLRDQTRLYQAMLDSWPELQQAVNRVADAVATLPWEVCPQAERGAEPEPAAQKLAAEVERAIWRMRPEVTAGERDLEDTMKDIVMGYFSGHYVGEVLWQRDAAGLWQPRGTRELPARYYGYPYDGPDQLMLDPEGRGVPADFQPFAGGRNQHRFLVAIHKGHPGHAATAAPFRALVGYWLAAVYGLRWFVTFTQLFGVPMRWAKVADETDIGKACEMLAQMGSAGYAAFKQGTNVEMLAPTTSGPNLPQKALIELANQQVAKFVLGQTLTTTVGDSGSRALGEVHQDTERQRIDAIADFVGKVLSRQLIPALLHWNYGAVPDCAPEFWPRRDERQDELAMAQRDKVLGIGTAALPVGRAWYYARHGIPLPAEGEELLGIPAATSAAEEPAAPAETKPEIVSEDETDEDAGGEGDLISG